MAKDYKETYIYLPTEKQIRTRFNKDTELFEQKNVFAQVWTQVSVEKSMDLKLKFYHRLPKEFLKGIELGQGSIFGKEATSPYYYLDDDTIQIYHEGRFYTTHYKSVEPTETKELKVRTIHQCADSEVIHLGLSDGQTAILEGELLADLFSSSSGLRALAKELNATVKGL